VNLLLNTVGTLYPKSERSTVQTSFKMKPTYDNKAHTSNVKVNSRTVRHNIQWIVAMQSSMTTGHSEGDGNQIDNLSLQRGYMDVRFMCGTKVTNTSATFNLDQSIKNFVVARSEFNKNFCILHLYGEGNPISKTQDMPNSNDFITVYYRFCLAGNDVSGKMRIQSSSSIV
jgi:hypothetical protein